MIKRAPRLPVAKEVFEYMASVMKDAVDSTPPGTLLGGVPGPIKAKKVYLAIPKPKDAARRPLATKKGRIKLRGLKMAALRELVWARSAGTGYFQCENWISNMYGAKLFRCYGIPSEMHHVIYRSQGGGDTLENCVAVCTPCHIGIHAGKFAFRRKDV